MTKVTPKVDYINEFYAIANVGGTIKEYSSVTEINQLVETQLDSVSLHVNKEDANNDLVPEGFRVRFSFNRLAAEKVTSLSLIMNLEYTLD